MRLSFMKAAHVDHGEPVLYLQNPSGVSWLLRRRMLDVVDEIDQQSYAEFGNPETVKRIAQYEMAFPMQMDATDAMDIHKESPQVLAAYAAKPGADGFANNCLLARRLAERGGALFSSTIGDGMITERMRRTP
jgi:hypothetical protein